MRNPNPPNRELLASYVRLAYILAAFALITIGVNLFIYFQKGIWQGLLPPLFILAAALVWPLVYRWLLWGKDRLAGIFTVAVLAVAYGGTELVWKGLTGMHVIGGCLLIALSGLLILPRRWKDWLAVMVGFLVFVFLVNRIPLEYRYEQSLVTPLLPLVINANMFLVAGLILLLVLQNPRRSLGMRLIATTAILVLIPALVPITVASMTHAQNAQDQVTHQLESVALMKEAEINTWIDQLVAELKIVKPTDQELSSFLAEDSPSAFSQAAGPVQDRFERLVRETGAFKDAFLVDRNGRIFLTTNPADKDRVVTRESYYRQTILPENIIPPTVSADGEVQMTVALPLSTGEITQLNNDRPILLVGSANIEKLNAILRSGAGLEPSGETYLVSPSFRLITPTKDPEYQPGTKYIYSDGITRAAETKENGSGVYSDFRRQNVIGVYHWLPRLEVALLVEQSQSTISNAVLGSILLNLGITIATLLLVLGFSWVETQRLATPLTRLSQTAEKAASGENDIEMDGEGLVETGIIARSFNSLISQLRGMTGHLDLRIQERTMALEKRSDQLEIATDVAREVVGLRDLKELLNRAVDLIHDRFDYYFVGIFLVDEPGDNAVLAAATGEAGQFLLARNHSVKIGEPGFVGDVALSGRVRIDNDIKQNPYYIANPLLPDTGSEIALPLKAGSTVIGVVDIHSLQVGVFTDETLYILNIIMDQLSIAVQNALLLQEMAQSIKELESVYGSSTSKSWQVIEQRGLAQRGYHYQNLVVSSPEGEPPSIQQAIQNGRPILTPIETDGDNKASMLTVPIKVRRQTIGAFELYFESPTIPSSVVSTYEEIADRLGLILENARLLQEAQRLAQREQQINLISSRVRSSINLEAVLQSTVQELGRAFGATRTFIQVGLENRSLSHPTKEGQGDPGQSGH